MIQEQVNLELGQLIYEQSVIKMFTEPFTDVIKTARHGLAKISTIAATKIGSLAKQAAFLAIPFIDIGKIENEANEKLNQKLQKIDSEFADVLKRNIDTLNKSDFWGLAFAFAPHQFFTTKVVKQAPEAVLGALDAMTGGQFPVIKKMENQLKRLHMNIFQGADGGVTGGTGFGSDPMDYGYDFGYDFGESKKLHIQEQQKPTKSQVNAVVGDKILKLISNPQVKSTIEQSPKIQKMQKMAFDTVIETLQNYLDFETPEEMKKVFGSNFASMQKELEKNIPKDITEEQKMELWNQMIPQVKNNIKMMYIKQLQKVAREVPATGANIQKLISAIQSL